MEIFLKLQKSKLKNITFLPSRQGYFLQELGEEGKQEEVEEDDLQAHLLLQQERGPSFKCKGASMEILEEQEAWAKSLPSKGKAWESLGKHPRWVGTASKARKDTLLGEHLQERGGLELASQMSNGYGV